MSVALDRKREFVKTCLSAAALSVLPDSLVHAQSVKQRHEWRAFVRNANNPSFYSTPLVQVQMHGEIFIKPNVWSFPLSGPRAIGPNRRSLGGARDIRLNEESITVRLPIEAQHRQTIRDMASTLHGLPPGRTRHAPFKSVQLVLDDARATSLGRAGGYFYKIYVNLPQQGDAAIVEQMHLVGSIGPFEIASAKRDGHTARFTFPLTRHLAASPGNPETVDVSLVRVSGANAPQGQVISIGEVRIEISDDKVE